MPGRTECVHIMPATNQLSNQLAVNLRSLRSSVLCMVMNVSPFVVLRKGLPREFLDVITAQ